jgi:hypothetical protein
MATFVSSCHTSYAVSNATSATASASSRPVYGIDVVKTLGFAWAYSVARRLLARSIIGWFFHPIADVANLETK